MEGMQRRTDADILADDVAVAVERANATAVVAAEADGEAAPRRVEDVVIVDDDERLHPLLQHRHQHVVVEELVAYLHNGGQ